MGGLIMINKIFTLDEANEMLPQLIHDLKHLQTLAGQFELQFQELQEKKAQHKQSTKLTATGENNDPFFKEESQIEFMRMEIDLQIDNFSRKGVLLKMINPGLIDFPSVLDGEDILICWKQGEERVSHYHGWHDGYAGRKPLPG
jgi:hypothetical protein